MHLLTVIPITRGIPVDELTYISSTPIEKGMLVKVPVRGRPVVALVVSSTPAESARAAIRSAPYTLKTVGQLKGKRLLSEAFVETCIDVSGEFLGTVGAAIASLVPTKILGGKVSTPERVTTAPDQGSREQLILQAETEERISTYKSIIREEFAKKRSVVMVLPTVQDIEQWVQVLERGIGDYTFVFHGGLSGAQMSTRWDAVLSTEHSVLIIGTPQALAIPRDDIGTVILERESSGSYRTNHRPFIDHRFTAARYAAHIGARFIMGDQFLRIETLWKAENGHYQEFIKPKFRTLSTATSSLIDLKGSEQPAAGKTTLFSPQFHSLFMKTTEEHAHMFVLGVRKGYAPITICGDCGDAVLCDHCKAPVVLYKEGRGAHTHDANFFLCHRCGEKRSAAERCRACDSWRLIPLGVGLDQAEELIHKTYPSVKVFRIDRDRVKSHKEAKEVAKAFFGTPGSILLGTEMAIPYIADPVAYAAVLSVQSLLTIPDFQMGEKVFRLIVAIRAKTTKQLIVQTRDTRPEIFQWALQGNLLDCYRNEIAMRKSFNYPPFTTVIKLTYEGTRVAGEKLMEEVERVCSIYHPVTFPGFVARIKQQYRMHALIFIPREKWPDPDLRALLASLPQDISIQINPESMI